jgi:hypothetical protein
MSNREESSVGSIHITLKTTFFGTTLELRSLRIVSKDRITEMITRCKGALVVVAWIDSLSRIGSILPDGTAAKKFHLALSTLRPSLKMAPIDSDTVNQEAELRISIHPNRGILSLTIRLVTHSNMTSLKFFRAGSRRRWRSWLVRYAAL